MEADPTVNIRGVIYGDRLWRKYYKPNKTLGNGLLWKLKKESFFDFSDPMDRLRIALDVLDTYSHATAERYFAQLKYGGYLNLPNISTLFLAKEHYGKIKRRAPQVRIPSIEEYQRFVNFLYDTLALRRTERLSTNPLKYDKSLGFIIMVLFVCNTALRLSEVLRLTTSHLRQLLDNNEIIELKMKSSKEWKVVYHKNLYKLLNEMRDIYGDFWDVVMRDGNEIIELKLFDFSKEYVRVQMKKIFAEANDNKSAPRGFGLHTIRYYIGSQLAQRNLKLAQSVLQHENISTSAIYVRYNNLKLQHALSDFEELSPLIVSMKNIFTKH